MAKLAMLCGIPGSGKSEYADSLKKRGYVVCSSDEIRQRLCGDVNSQEHNVEVFKTLHAEIIDHLKNSENVVYDACNINAKRRRAFLNTLRAAKVKCEKEAHVIIAPYIECLHRCSNRERVVPYDVVSHMYRHWQTPGEWEGFDRVELICSSPDYNFDPSSYDNYDQNNPHHTHTLGEHMKLTAEYVAKKSDDMLLYEAALRHDIGKPFCRIDDEGGVSHYPDHAGVGAYDILSDWEFVDEEVLEISRLITYHMYPIFWGDNKKVADKYKKLWGKKFYDQIMLLREADAAS